jgi:hypothetical protein
MEGKTREKVSRGRGRKKENIVTYILKFTKKRPFNINLKVKRPDTPLVEGKKEKKWGQSDIFNFMATSKISFQSIRQYAWFIWEVNFSERMEARKVWGNSIIQNEWLTAYIPRYVILIKKRVNKNVPEYMELENLMQQLNPDNHKKAPHTFPGY